jgi:hypothetical protein
MPLHEETILCEVCKGQGFIEVDDFTSMLCSCARNRLMRAHLGPEIASAKKIKSSPLFKRGPTPQEPIQDRTQENLFIRGPWQLLLAHFRYTLICKGLLFRFQIVTDQRIKTVFVGAEAAQSRTREERESSKKSYNSLADIVCEHDLLILRLGFLGHKNQAMAGALKEALMLREVQHMPTWIVDMPGNEFVNGHRAFSEENSDYIFSHFAVLDFTNTEKPATHAPIPERQPAVEPPRFDEKDQPLEEDARPSVEPDDVAGIMGESATNKRKYKKFGGKFKKHSGGPV